MMINFVTEYTDGLYNYLALQTGVSGELCGWGECKSFADCSLYDAEGGFPSRYCLLHVLELDQDEELSWSKTTGQEVPDEEDTPDAIVAEWIKLHPGMFVRLVSPEEAS